MIGDRIKEIRKELHLSQAAFGDRLGVGKSTISHVEKREGTVTDQLFKAICTVYNVNPAWLRDGEEPMFFSPDPDMLKAVERLLASDNEPAKVLMGAMTKMTPEQWQKMGEVLQILNAEQQALSSTGKQKPAE